MYYKLEAYFTIIIIIVFLFSCKPIDKAVSPSAGKEKKASYFAFKSELLEGVKNKMTGNYDAALENFTRAMRWDPDQAVSYYEIATVLSIKKDFQAALGYSKTASSLSGNNYYYKLLLASLFQANGMMAEAAATYDDVINIKPSVPENYFSQSSIYLSINNTKKAIQSLDKAEEYFGVSEEINSEKFNIAVSAGNYSLAGKEIIKLIEVYPDECRYYAMLAELYKIMGKHAEAEATYKKIESMNIDNGMVYISLAEYYSALGNNEKAFGFLESAFLLTEFDMDSKIQILFNLITPTENDKVLTDKVYKLLEILVSVYPDEPKVQTIYADYLVRDGRWKEAQYRFSTVLNKEKSHYEIWEQALYVDNELNDWETMFGRSNEAIQYFPMQTALYVFNCEAAFQLKKYEEMVVAASSGIKYASGNNDLKLNFLTYLGEGYHKLHQHELSDSVFEEALKIDPDNTFLLNNYSYYLSVRNEKIDRAVQLSEQLIQLEPDNINYSDTHAWALFRNQKYSEALLFIEKAIQLGGEKNPEILEHYGDILFKSGDTEKAVLFWKKSQEAGSGSKTIQKKIEKQSFLE